MGTIPKISTILRY